MLENYQSNPDRHIDRNESSQLSDEHHAITSKLYHGTESDSRHTHTDTSNLKTPASAESSVPKLTLSDQSDPMDKINKPGNYSEIIMVGDTPRHFLLHVPPNYDKSKPMPLLLVLHGYTGDAPFIEKVSGMDAEADKNGFIVAYPEATQWFGNKQLSAWDTGNGLTPPDQHADDIGFLRKVIDNCQSRLSVDQSRIYLDGFSNGGMEVYKAAGEMSDKIAAVADISGAMGGAERKPDSPVSVFSIVGTGDWVVPPDGRTKEQVAASGVPDVMPLLAKVRPTHKDQPDQPDQSDSPDSQKPLDAPDQQIGSAQDQKLALKYGIVPEFKPVDYATNFWKDADGISGPGKITHNGAITTEVYTNPQNGVTVEQETVAGADHCIQNGFPAGFNLADETWKFLSAHRKTS